MAFEMRLPALGYVYTCSDKLAPDIPNVPSPTVNPDNPFARFVQPASAGDLTVNYVHNNAPKFNLAGRWEVLTASRAAARAAGGAAVLLGTVVLHGT